MKHFQMLMAAGLLLTAAGCSQTTNNTTTTTAADSPTSANPAVANMATTPHYDVVFRDGEVTVDGKTDEEVWDDVLDISGSFHYPWEAKEAPKTVFKAFNDGTDLYFYFESEDPEVLMEEEWKDDESTVDVEDRVEIFLAQGPVDKPTTEGMPLYYGVEIDADGRVHDYSIEYYRDFDSTWNLEGLNTAATETDNGYIVEGSIPLATLKDLGILKDNNSLRIGLYRAEFSTQDGKEELLNEWISWVDPKTEAPDYHVDSSFGEMRILEQ